MIFRKRKLTDEEYLRTLAVRLQKRRFYGSLIAVVHGLVLGKFVWIWFQLFLGYSNLKVDSDLHRLQFAAATLGGVFLGTCIALLIASIKACIWPHRSDILLMKQHEEFNSDEIRTIAFDYRSIFDVAGNYPTEKEDVA
jgi:hypothetical protein